MQPNQMPDLSPAGPAVYRQAPLVLDEPHLVWIIQTGTIGLFTVRLKDGMPAGARRYLNSFGPGAALFGTTPDPGESYALLAVPFQDTQLLPVLWEEFVEQFTLDQAATIALVDGWVAALDAMLPRLPLISSHREAAPAQKYALGTGESLQTEPRTMTWIHLLQGSVNWMGRQELSLTPASGLFPLGPGMWVVANDAVELETMPTAAISAADTLLAGLAAAAASVAALYDTAGAATGAG